MKKPEKAEITEMDEFLNVYQRIPDMTIEELPEYLVHKEPLIRAQARARMLEINYRIKRLCHRPRWLYRVRIKIFNKKE